MIKSLFKVIVFFGFITTSAFGSQEIVMKKIELVPFLAESENILDYNDAVVSQRAMIRNRRLFDQRRKFQRKYATWIKDRPHLAYQQKMEEDAPVVLTESDLPSEIVFYDLFPELRKSSRDDYIARRYNDRMRFIDYDRHQTVLGETVFEETTGRYLDDD